MTDRLFVDTNLLIYMHDPREPTKRAEALAWYAAMVRARNIVLSVQVLSEFYVVALRRFAHASREQIRSFVNDLRPLCTAPFGVETISRAREVQDLSNYSWYDCLIVAAAIDGGCRYLITEDLDHGRSFSALTIIDPFRASPASLFGTDK